MILESGCRVLSTGTARGGTLTKRSTSGGRHRAVARSESNACTRMWPTSWPIPPTPPALSLSKEWDGPTALLRALPVENRHEGRGHRCGHELHAAACRRGDGRRFSAARSPHGAHSIGGGRGRAPATRSEGTEENACDGCRLCRLVRRIRSGAFARHGYLRRA